MKVIVGWALVGLGLLFTFVWAAYAFVDAQLPELETRQDVEQLLLANLQVEHEGSAPPAGGSPLGPLPPDLVQLYLTQWECPRFLAEPKQGGLSWKLGLLPHLFFGL